MATYSWKKSLRRKVPSLGSRPKFSHHNSRIDFGTLIYEASKQGDFEGLELILSQTGASYFVNTAGRDGLTPLTVAAKNGDLSCVKLLLANKCDLHLKGCLNGKEKFAWEISNEFGHSKITKYLNGCVDDLIKYHYHRAMMEADVIEICCSNTITENDLHEFHKHMTRLLKMDTFCLDGDELTPSLIVLAAEADNQLIVEQLLEKYNATPFANNQNGETALHLACRKKSDLRYYLTKKIPQLLFAVNVEGVQPLHISCENNDLEYFTWIFQSVLENIESKGGLIYDPQENSSTEQLLQSGFENLHDTNAVVNQGNSPLALQDVSKSNSLMENSSEIHPCDSQSSILDSCASSSPANLQKSFTISFLETTSNFLKQTCNTYGNSPLTIQDILSLHMRLFAIDIYGSSILHIAAKHGFSDLLQLVLQVAKVFEHSPDSIDLKILINSDATINPIEQAITANQPLCLRLLLDFASMTSIFDEIANDDTLFTTVINMGNQEMVEVLLEFGLSKGLKKAINQAKLIGKKDLLRILIFYQTQLMCYSFYKCHKQLDVKKSSILWDQLDLIEVDKDWIEDAKVAVASVFHTINELHLHQSKKSRDVLAKLGKNCIDYFKVFVWLPQTCPYSWQSCIITELNISGNQLELIPLEIFQIQTLLCLDLSHNRLHRLPSSLNIQNPLYKCHSLAKLNLSSNLLQTLPEDFFFAFGKSLEELRASNNSIETLPPGLWICPMLHTLALGRNKLQSLHYFNDKKFFYDESFSHSLINGLTIEGGVPINCGNLDDEQFMNMIKYVTRLNIFYQTVKVLIPEVIEEDIKNDASLLQHVIDIHWLRSKLTNGKQALDSQYFDVSLPSDECCALKILDLSYNEFSLFPWNLACISPNLEKLDMRGNQLKSCNIIKDLPSNIESVILSDNALTSIMRVCSSNPCGSPVKLISGYLTDPKLHGECKHTEHNVLSKVTNIILNCNKLTEFPCTREPIIVVPKSLQKLKSLDSSQYQCLFPNLSVLSLDQNNLQAVPNGIQFLSQLSSLSLSHNASISRIPSEIGTMNPQTLLIFKLEGVYPKNVDSQLLKKPGARPLLTYLKMLHQKSVPYYRLKLMIIGNCNVGKTSLLLSLTNKGKVTRFKDVEKGINKLPLSTVGVDLGDWEYQMSKRPKVTFMTWDFGGQEEYYATHQCFLTRRSLYVLVWNVEMNEAGLASLKPWLENIGGRVPGAPVVVVGTHIDSIPLEKRYNVLNHFNLLFKKMYLDVTPRAFPNIYKKCFFVSSFDGTNINSFREELYEFALSIKPVGRQYGHSESLVKQHIPECYIRLQDRVRDIAQRCSKEKRHPVLTTEEIKDLAFSASCFDNIDELDQGIQFLHENGILLHYDDPALSDLYFVDPQWLCSILAHVVTIHERNPFQKNGFMEFSALQLLLKDTKFPQTLVKELVSLMQKFEVAHLLNNNYILIPSLLPSDESRACIVSPSCSTYNGQSTTSFKGTTVSMQTFSSPNVSIFVRYYLLPFIPNGFFPRVIARILASEIGDFFTQYLPDDAEKNLQWRCWRNGIVMIMGNVEVVRVSPVRLPMANVDDIVLISSSGHREILLNNHSIIQVVVSIFPEKLVRNADAVKNESIDIAIWILRKLIDIIDSVFDDWYDAFARTNGFDSEAVQQASPCSKCLQQTATHAKDQEQSSISTITSQLSSYISSQRTLHLFSSPFCVLIASRNKRLICPVHGPIRVSDISPDLSFADFSRNSLFYESDSTIQKLESIGAGGFGSVHKGILEHNGNRQKIAIKEFLGVSGKRELEGDEAFYWDIYLTGSKEARIMNYLRHPNILSLIGLAFDPLRLLLELAPKGDLKDCIKPFKKLQYKLSRRVLKILMYQLADAMEYIHSKNVIYRDMKPGNVLVWEFPHPKSQSDDGVLVKLADYGISKYCTPEGVRGSEGTPAYLPPEVVVGGGSTSYSTKLDVYSYGMVLYYLYTFLGPFETEKGRPISALLEEGMRPEISPVNLPLAVQMYELMCWCWEEKPAFRPTFSQIKSVIKNDTFTHLIGTSALPYDDDVYTTVSVQAYHLKNTSQENRNDFTSSTAAPSPSVANLLAASIIQDQRTRVWYGTNQGRLGYIQFPSSKDSFVHLHDLKHPITCICDCGNQIWVGTNGRGIIVYDLNNPNNVIATWSQSEIIYQILYVKESGDTIVLTANGVMVFETFKIKADAKIPLVTSRTSCVHPVVVHGVLAHKSNGDHEVWCCSTSGKLRIFDVTDINKFISLMISKAESYVLQYFEVNSQHKVAVCMGNLLQIWDVDTHKQEGSSFDTHTSCYTLYGPNAEKSFIASLLANKDIIYIGTRGGIILMFNYSLRSVVSVLQGYNSTVSCLASISPMYCKIRGMTKQYSQSDRQSLDRSSISSISDTVTNSIDSKHEGCIVLSFGKAYVGMVDNIKNCPKDFLSPAGLCNTCFSLPGMKCMCEKDNRSKFRPIKPDRKTNYMLFWFNSNL